MSISEAPASSSGDTPSINNSSNRSKAKSKCSIRSLVTSLKDRYSLSNPKPLEKNDQSAASSNATANRSDQHSGALSLTELIQHELRLVDSTFTEAKKYIDHANAQINQEKFNQACEKFEELQRRGSTDQRDLDELRKAILKMKIKIPSQKISCADSNRHHSPWPNVNNVGEEMMHFFYKEPELAHTGDLDGCLKAYHDLPEPLRYCLLCFFKFPTEAMVKRTIMIYLWIGQGSILWAQLSRKKLWPIETEEDVGNQILDELTTKGFIEPVYQKCSFVPDSCRMSHFVRSSLANEAKVNGFILDNGLDLDTGFVDDGLCGHTCVVNVGEAIIDGAPETFEKMKHVYSLYLGRWQNLSTHHIEVVDAKILRQLKKLKHLKFLSLRGISMITELSSFISKLNDMKILDLKACHNLELIPDNIGLLKNLTHIDMSECYFLEYMPKGIAELSNLEVLKGFIVRDYNYKKEQCTLHDLSRLEKLQKLNIYTNSECFPSQKDLRCLSHIYGLQKLTINWGGCSFVRDTYAVRETIGNDSLVRRRRAPAQLIRARHLYNLAVLDGTQSNPGDPATLHFKLQKLDLRGFPGTSAPYWLRPWMLTHLKKLYIRGGKLRDIRQFHERPALDLWKVNILRLKFLRELKIDWSGLRLLFPKLIYLHQEECPMFSNFPCDKNGVWMDKKAIDTLVQQQHFKKATSISSNSTSGSGPSAAQNDCNICPIDVIVEE